MGPDAAEDHRRRKKHIAEQDEAVLDRLGGFLLPHQVQDAEHRGNGKERIGDEGEDHMQFEPDGPEHRRQRAVHERRSSRAREQQEDERQGKGGKEVPAAIPGYEHIYDADGEGKKAERVMEPDERNAAVGKCRGDDQACVQRQGRNDEPGSVERQGIEYEEDIVHSVQTEKASRVSGMPFVVSG